jgi:hypothetical protein
VAYDVPLVHLRGAFVRKLHDSSFGRRDQDVLQHVPSNLVASIDGMEFVSWTESGLVRIVELEAEVE